jgi:hypothetical protein
VELVDGVTTVRIDHPPGNAFDGGADYIDRLLAAISD